MKKQAKPKDPKIANQPQASQSKVEPKGNLEKITFLRANSKKRKFQQSFDLIINLKNVDLKKPENRFTIDFRLPEGRGKKPKIVFFADSKEAEAKKVFENVLKRSDIEKLVKSKKELKKLASNTDSFLAEITLMAEIGKSLGAVLAPRGKMPRPVPPNIPLEGMQKMVTDSIRIALKNSPVIQVPVGTEITADNALLKNIDSVVNAVIEKMPKGRANVRSVYLKLTMGAPIKLEVS